MTRFKTAFPGFKVIPVPGKGYRVQCRADCFRLGGRFNEEPTRPFAVVATIPDIRAWIDQHEHARTMQDARAEGARRIAERQTSSWTGAL